MTFEHPDSNRTISIANIPLTHLLCEHIIIPEGAQVHHILGIHHWKRTVAEHTADSTLQMPSSNFANATFNTAGVKIAATKTQRDIMRRAGILALSTGASICMVFF
jgi:hypothetical protein